MNLDKLYHTGDLRKETRQSDNLSDAAARILEGIRALILENPADASLEQLVDSFRRALQAFDSRINDAPAERAKRFGQEIDGIIRNRQFGMAAKASLSKGMHPYDFYNNRGK
jgi:hypothetical protein